MEQKEMITLMEEAIGKHLNEEAIGTLIDARLQKALEPIKRSEVILGEIPDEQTRDENVTFSQWLGDITRHMAGGSHPKLGSGLKWLKPEQLAFKEPAGGAKKDLYEGSTTAGGYLVPTEESRELLDVQAQKWNVIPALCRQVPMMTNQITFPTLTSGLTGYWVPEAGSTSTLGKDVDGSQQSIGEKIRSDITTGQMAIVAHVYAVVVVVSNQLLDDSDPAVDMVLRNLFSETLFDGWDTACLMGAGTTTDPITGLNSKITTNALQAGAQFNFDDITDLVFACLHQDTRQMPQIIGNTYAEQVLRKVKDDDGQYLYKTPREDGAMPTIWGYTYNRDGNILNTYGTNNNKTRLFAGDFARHGYAGKRMGVTIMANPFAEPYFSFNQTAYRAEFRVGFNVDDERFFAKMDGVPTS